MAKPWIPLALNHPLFANADEHSIVGYQTAIENGILNEMGAQTRFPGMVDFATLGDDGRAILSEWRGDLIATTSKGRTYSMDPQGRVRDRTGTVLSGGQRAIHAPSRDSLQIAAGGPILRLRDQQTELLSSAAPLASHVAWLGTYTIAAEINTNRIYHSGAGRDDEWDPLDTYAADGDPDNITALLVTPFRELMIGGKNSVEQFEQSESGESPFFRRWSVGEGLGAPYCMVHADSAMWSINRNFQLVRAAGQVALVASSEVGGIFDDVDDWDEAWIGGYPNKPLTVAGQNFILLQMPKATNAHGSKGITLLYDYKNKRWSELYGWSLDDGIPVRWPGWSHWSIWERTFVGGEGKVYEIKSGVGSSYYHAGAPARWLVRTAYISDANKVSIDALQLNIKRGLGGSATESTIAIRCRRDGGAFGNWVMKSLGKAGETTPALAFGSFGTGYSFQFEITTTDDVQVDLLKAEIQVTQLGH